VEDELECIRKWLLRRWGARDGEINGKAEVMSSMKKDWGFPVPVPAFASFTGVDSVASIDDYLSFCLGIMKIHHSLKPKVTFGLFRCSFGYGSSMLQSMTVPTEGNRHQEAGNCLEDTFTNPCCCERFARHE
jgi:hypothetical protein